MFSDYIQNLLNSVPGYVYEGFFSVVVVTFVLGVSFKSNNRFLIVWKVLLAEYIFLIYCSTLLYRERLYKAKYSFTPLRSYSEYIDGKEILLYENIMNVVVFIPIGVLACFAFPKTKWWIIALAGCVLSISIEILQYTYHRGFSEVDDVMHNTLGCLIGVVIVHFIQPKEKR